MPSRAHAAYLVENPRVIIVPHLELPVTLPEVHGAAFPGRRTARTPRRAQTAPRRRIEGVPPSARPPTPSDSHLAPPEKALTDEHPLVNRPVRRDLRRRRPRSSCASPAAREDRLDNRRRIGGNCRPKHSGRRFVIRFGHARLPHSATVNVTLFSAVVESPRNRSTR